MTRSGTEADSVTWLPRPGPAGRASSNAGSRAAGPPRAGPAAARLGLLVDGLTTGVGHREVHPVARDLDSLRHPAVRAAQARVCSCPPVARRSCRCRPTPLRHHCDAAGGGPVLERGEPRGVGRRPLSRAGRHAAGQQAGQQQRARRRASRTGALEPLAQLLVVRAALERVLPGLAGRGLLAHRPLRPHRGAGRSPGRSASRRARSRYGTRLLRACPAGAAPSPCCRAPRHCPASARARPRSAPAPRRVPRSVGERVAERVLDRSASPGRSASSARSSRHGRHPRDRCVRTGTRVPCAGRPTSGYRTSPSSSTSSAPLLVVDRRQQAARCRSRRSRTARGCARPNSSRCSEPGLRCRTCSALMRATRAAPRARSRRR